MSLFRVKYTPAVEIGLSKKSAESEVVLCRSGQDERTWSASEYKDDFFWLSVLYADLIPGIKS